ncbi:MAG: helical backbone metal receptor [Bryobacteraceae bacterium]|jgi:iron complex transport system substrate-binding protein
MRRALLFTLSFALCAAGADMPQRIVSLSPDLTEILYGVGAFNRVVGVSNYETYPPEAAKLPSLGQLHNPNLEKLTALRPDLVVINNAQAPFLEDTLKELGLRVLQTSNRSIKEVLASMIAIGHATGNDVEAAKLSAATREALDRVARKTDRLPKPRVVLIVNRTPGTLRDLSTATEGSFLAELVEIAGGRIVVQPAKSGYGRLAKEDLLAIDPDIILDFIHGPKSRFAGDPVEAWREMPELKAVRAHRIHGVNEDFVPHASQRIVQTAVLFAKLIHPEIE